MGRHGARNRGTPARDESPVTNSRGEGRGKEEAESEDSVDSVRQVERARDWPAGRRRSGCGEGKDTSMERLRFRMLGELRRIWRDYAMLRMGTIRTDTRRRE